VIAESAALILGPELVLWRTNFFAIRQGRGLPWHQDEYRTLLSDPLAQVSIHLGITGATEANCIMVLPGSHRMTIEELADEGFNFIPGTDKGAYGAPNFWRDPSRSLNITRMLLRPGEFFVFHPRLIHASHDLTAPANDPRKAPLFPAALPPPRVGFGLRITVPENEVLPAAFAETITRGDHCVRMICNRGDYVLR
jgi:ectoine hydroxylase-related dioxygenase (phytanoyl-CoA dioxygenase family)